MMIYALRWPIDAARAPADEGASDGFFRTLADLVAEALDHEAPLSLPTSDDPIVAAAMAYTKEHLDSVTSEEVSRAVAVSERTLRRLFQHTLGLSWRDVSAARPDAASDGAAGRAHAVGAGRRRRRSGFDSLSSFTRAFTQFCGETPAAYRKRVAGAQV